MNGIGLRRRGSRSNTRPAGTPLAERAARDPWSVGEGWDPPGILGALPPLGSRATGVRRRRVAGTPLADERPLALPSGALGVTCDYGGHQSSSGHSPYSDWPTSSPSSTCTTSSLLRSSVRGSFEPCHRAAKTGSEASHTAVIYHTGRAIIKRLRRRVTLLDLTATLVSKARIVVEWVCKRPGALERPGR